ncbi:hypothetical protein [Mixta intestinalis]|uniref:Uncharacterized protein n=1 Tax=Mixta intestinalis TaxID=1615494 RepID=A0A6P1Q4J7_9GAMM|nr:hypothetical protein [Mixta intestinalis]QHM74000.1 hypothetical protein C7M51_04361 [Mixta intestinalis]
MKNSIAIVGGGVTAALSTYFLVGAAPVTLYRPASSSVGQIPEIIPRRVFFTVLNKLNEEEMINFCKPLQKTIIWEYNGRVREIPLSSNKNFFVYDKFRLADYLFMHTGKKISNETKEVVSIADLSGYARIYDCRGTRAVTHDAAYGINKTSEAITACRYLITRSVGEVSDTVMRFWTDTVQSGRGRTYFRIPVSQSNVSFGCSSHPSDPVSEDELLAFFDTKDLPVDEGSILYRGFVTPHINTFRCNQPHVISLGDAQRSPCPLTEYGTLAALKQVGILAGNMTAAKLNISRQFHNVSDPHLPMELFYE